MREDNLLAGRRAPPSAAQRSIRTVRIYLNLACRMKVFGPNQLWIADITYIGCDAHMCLTEVVSS